jgi:hypothetical protein
MHSFADVPDNAYYDEAQTDYTVEKLKELKKVKNHSSLRSGKDDQLRD